MTTTKETLLESPDLCKLCKTMSQAIIQDPSLIRYLKVEIDIAIIRNALESYPLTSDDFNKNPELGKLKCIRDYYRNIGRIRLKELIKHYLINRDFECIEIIVSLFGYTLAYELKIVLKALFPLYNDFDGHNTQREQWHTLKNLIAGIASFRYENQKERFKYQSVDQLLLAVEQYFLKKYKNISKEKIIEQLTSILIENMSLSQKYYERVKTAISRLYDIFISNNYLMPRNAESEATRIGNTILNYHRSHYIKCQTKSINTLVSNQFKSQSEIIVLAIRCFIKEYSIQNYSRNINKLLDGVRKKLKLSCEPELDNKILAKIGTAFLNQNYDEIFNRLLIDISKKLKSKYNIEIEEEIFNQIINLLRNEFFKSGCLTVEFIKNIFKSHNIGISKDICKDISKLFDQYFIYPILKELQSIIVKEKFVSLDSTCDTLSELALLLIDHPDELRRAYENSNQLPKISFIVPLIGRIPGFFELSSTMLLYIIENYDEIALQIKECLDKESYRSLNQEEIINCFDKVIKYAYAFRGYNNLIRAVCNLQFLNLLMMYEENGYMRFYADEVFSRFSSSIPIIEGTTTNYIFESNFKDQNRLVFGRMIDRASCLCLNHVSGGETYKECLSGSNGDVIIIRNRINNVISGIVMAIRRGNVIQLQFYNLNNKIPVNDSEEILNYISLMMINYAKAANDNLCAVVLSTSNYLDKEDTRFYSEFPHADWTGTYRKLCSSFPNDIVQFDFKLASAAMYYKPREEISTLPDEIKMTRLKAISILRSHDPQKEKEFVPVSLLGINNPQVFIGEDWYLIFDGNELVEELLVPVDDPRQKEEVEQARACYLSVNR